MRTGRPRKRWGQPKTLIVAEFFNTESVKQTPKHKLAKRAGLTPETIYRYEDGDRDPNIYFFDYLLQAAGYQLTLRSIHASTETTPCG